MDRDWQAFACFVCTVRTIQRNASSRLGVAWTWSSRNDMLIAGDTRTTAVYDNANQIKYSAVAAGRTTYSFDANGNQQIVREPAGSRTTTTSNFESQPTLFRMPDGSRVTMTYNANNRRVKRK